MSTATEVQTRPNADETVIADVTRELLVRYLDTFGLAAELTEEEKEQFIQVAIAYQLDPFRREWSRPTPACRSVTRCGP